jgi:hypothetical protein
MSSPSQPAEPHKDQVAAGEQDTVGKHAEGSLESVENSTASQGLFAGNSSTQQDVQSLAAGQASEEGNKINVTEKAVKKNDAHTAGPPTAVSVEISPATSEGSIGAKPESQSFATERSDGAMIPAKDELQRATTPPPELPSKKEEVRSPSPPPPPPKDEKYLASNLDIPVRAISPMSEEGNTYGRKSEDADAAEYNEKYMGSQDGVDDSRSEIQSIMEQFDDENASLNLEKIMSPRLELAGPVPESPISHPPRRSSLEPLSAAAIDESGLSNRGFGSPPPRTSSLYRVSTGGAKDKAPMHDHPSSPAIHKPPPPEPDPEPDLPFDFHRFLEQLRHRTADPVAKFLRSFLLEFGKKQWMVHEQVKIIGDFLEFISKKMAQCEVWRTVSDAEFDNAREGMEKLVMNRLYSQTFSPAIAPPEPVIAARGKRRGGQEPAAQGRRGQHQEDVERDEVLAQKVRIYKWVKEEHLDISPVGDKGRKFLVLAQQGWHPIYSIFSNTTFVFRADSTQSY